MSRPRSTIAIPAMMAVLLLGTGCGLVPGLGPEPPEYEEPTLGPLGAPAEPYDGELPDEVDYGRERSLITKDHTACEMADIAVLADYMEAEELATGKIFNSPYDPGQPIQSYGRCQSFQVLYGTSQSPHSDKPSETTGEISTSVLAGTSEVDHMEKWEREVGFATDNTERTSDVDAPTSTQIKDIEGPWEEGKIFYRNDSDTTSGSSGKKVNRFSARFEVLIRDRGLVIGTVLQWNPDYGQVNMENWGKAPDRQPNIVHKPKEVANWLTDTWAPRALQDVHGVLQGQDPAGENR